MTVIEVRCFLRDTGLYRSFIKSYANIAKLLSDMLSGDNSMLKGKRVNLSTEVLAAYEDLKMRCMTAPVLTFANFKKPFMLETNISKEGLGAVLSQKQSDRRYHPVAFANHALHGGEKNCLTSKLEFFALKWAITEQFCQYLQYGHFTIRTDNNPLTYILTTLNLDVIGHHWVAAWASFDISIEYLRGTENKVAHMLSHVSIWLDKDTIDKILEHAKDSMVPRAETDDHRLVQQVEIMKEDFVIQVRAITDEDPAMKRLQQADWPMVQTYDPMIHHVLDWALLPGVGWVSLGDYLEGKVPNGMKWPYALYQKDFVIKQQMLYLKMTPPNTQEEVFVFIIPHIKWRAALDRCHLFMGHQGQDRTLSLLKEQFWWPSMAKEAVLALKNCRQCLVFKANIQMPKLAPILTTEPMDLVHIDLSRWKYQVIYERN